MVGTMASNKHALCFLDFRRRLNEEFQKRQVKNPSFSLRAFAHFLKIDPSSLQKIMWGKRPLGAKVIQGMGKRLGISESNIEVYVRSHKERRKTGTSLANDRRRAGYKVLTKPFSSLVARWETYAILELSSLPAFDFTAGSVARAIGTTEAQAAQLIEDLENLEWIKKDAGGKYHSQIASSTTDPLDPEMQSARHLLMKSILEKSLDSYLNIPSAHTIHYARTLRFDRQLMGQVMAKIRSLFDDLESFIETESQGLNDVYQLQLGLYPLTRFFETRHGDSPLDGSID